MARPLDPRSARPPNPSPGAGLGNRSAPPGDPRRRARVLLDPRLRADDAGRHPGRSGASTGSIYHHFGSKERIAASLYLEGVRQTQVAGIDALLRTRTARTGVAAQVGSYIDWVVEQPGARPLPLRHAPRAVPRRRRAGDRRLERRRPTRSAAGSRTGWPPASSPTSNRRCAGRLVFGPCRHWAGSWLRGTTTTSPEQAKRIIYCGIRLPPSPALSDWL